MMALDLCRCSSSDCILCHYDGTYSLDLENRVHRNVVANFLARSRSLENTDQGSIRFPLGLRTPAIQTRKSNGSFVNCWTFRANKQPQKIVYFQNDSLAGSSRQGLGCKKGRTLNSSETDGALVNIPAVRGKRATSKRGTPHSSCDMAAINKVLNDLFKNYQTARFNVESANSASEINSIGIIQNPLEHPFSPTQPLSDRITNDRICRFLAECASSTRQAKNIAITEKGQYTVSVDQEIGDSIENGKTSRVEVGSESSGRDAANIEITKNTHELAPVVQELSDCVRSDKTSRILVESESRTRPTRNTEIILNHHDIVPVDQEVCDKIENNKVSRLDVVPESSGGQTKNIEIIQNSDDLLPLNQEFSDRVNNIEISRTVRSENSSTTQTKNVKIIRQPQKLETATCEPSDRVKSEKTYSLDLKSESSSGHTNNVEIIQNSYGTVTVTQRLDGRDKTDKASTLDRELMKSSRNAKNNETIQNSVDLDLVTPELNNSSVKNNECSRLDEKGTRQMTNNEIMQMSPESYRNSGRGNNETRADAGISNKVERRKNVLDDSENALSKTDIDSAEHGISDLLERNTSQPKTPEQQLTDTRDTINMKETPQLTKPVKIVLRRKTDIPKSQKTQFSPPKKRHSKNLKNRARHADYWEVILESLSDLDRPDKLSADHDIQTIPASTTNIPMASPLHLDESKVRDAPLNFSKVNCDARETICDSLKDVNKYSQSGRRDACKDNLTENPKNDTVLEVEIRNTDPVSSRNNSNSTTESHHGVELNVIDAIKGEGNELGNSDNLDSKPELGVFQEKVIPETSCNIREFEPPPISQNPTMMSSNHTGKENNNINLGLETLNNNLENHSVEKVKEETSHVLGSTPKVQELKDDFSGKRSDLFQERLPLKMVMKGNEEKVIGSPHPLSTELNFAGTSSMSGERNSLTLGRKIRPTTLSSAKLTQCNSLTQGGSSCVQSNEIKPSSTFSAVGNQSTIPVDNNSSIEKDSGVSTDSVTCNRPLPNVTEADRCDICTAPITKKRELDIYQTAPILEKYHGHSSMEKGLMERGEPSISEYAVTSASRDSRSSVIVRNHSDKVSPFKETVLPSVVIPNTYPNTKILNTCSAASSPAINTPTSTTTNRSMPVNRKMGFQDRTAQRNSRARKPSNVKSTKGSCPLPSRPSENGVRTYRGTPPNSEGQKTSQFQSFACNSTKCFESLSKQGFTTEYPTSNVPSYPATASGRYSHTADVKNHGSLATRFLEPECKGQGATPPLTENERTLHVNSLADYCPRKVENTEKQGLRPNLQTSEVSTYPTKSSERYSQQAPVSKAPLVTSFIPSECSHQGATPSSSITEKNGYIDSLADDYTKRFKNDGEPGFHAKFPTSETTRYSARASSHYTKRNEIEKTSGSLATTSVQHEFSSQRGLPTSTVIPRTPLVESLADNCPKSFESTGIQGLHKNIPTPGIPTYPTIMSSHYKKSSAAVNVTGSIATTSKQPGLNYKSSALPSRELLGTHHAESLHDNYYPQRFESTSGQGLNTKFQSSEIPKYPANASGHCSSCSPSKEVPGLLRTSVAQPELSHQEAISAFRDTDRTPRFDSLADVDPKHCRNTDENPKFQIPDLPSYSLNPLPHYNQYTPESQYGETPRIPRVDSLTDNGSKRVESSVQSKPSTKFQIRELLRKPENAIDNYSHDNPPTMKVPAPLATRSLQHQLNHRQPTQPHRETQKTPRVDSLANGCRKRSEDTQEDRFHPKFQISDVLSYPTTTSDHYNQFTPTNSPRRSEVSSLSEVVNNLAATQINRPMPKTDDQTQFLNLSSRTVGVPNRNISRGDGGASVTNTQLNSLKRTVIANNKKTQLFNSYSVSMSGTTTLAHQSAATSNLSSECVSALTDGVHREISSSKQVVSPETAQRTTSAHLKELQTSDKGSTTTIAPTAVIRSPPRIIPEHIRKSKAGKVYSRRTAIGNFDVQPSLPQQWTSQPSSISSASTSRGNIDHIDQRPSFDGSATASMWQTNPYQVVNYSTPQLSMSYSGHPRSLVNNRQPGSSTHILTGQRTTERVQGGDGEFSSGATAVPGSLLQSSIFGTDGQMSALLHNSASVWNTEDNSCEMNTPRDLFYRPTTAPSNTNQLSFCSGFSNYPHSSATSHSSLLPAANSGVHSYPIASMTSVEMSLARYIQAVHDIIGSLYGSDQRSRTSEAHTNPFITEYPFTSAESLLWLYRYAYFSALNDIGMAATVLSNMSQPNVFHESTSNTFLSDSGSLLSSTQSRSITRKRTSAALYLPSSHDIDQTSSVVPKKPRLLQIKSSPQTRNDFECENAHCGNRMNMDSQVQLLGGTIQSPTSPLIEIHHFSTVDADATLPILGTARVGELLSSIHDHMDINREEQHVITLASSSTKTLPQDSQTVISEPTSPPFIPTIDNNYCYSREIEECSTTPVLNGDSPNVDRPDEKSQSIELSTTKNSTVCPPACVMPLAIQPSDIEVAPKVLGRNYHEPIESGYKCRPTDRPKNSFPSTDHLIRSTPKVRHVNPLKSFTNRRRFGCRKKLNVQKQKRFPGRVTRAYSEYLCNIRNIKYFVVICDDEGFLIKADVLANASPIVRKFIKMCALTADSDGRCIFEVRGIAGWAMEELLNYLHFGSYNGDVMKSSYMAKVAEKFEIKIEHSPHQNKRLSRSLSESTLMYT